MVIHISPPQPCTTPTCNNVARIATAEAGSVPDNPKVLLVYPLCPTCVEKLSKAYSASAGERR